MFIVPRRSVRTSQPQIVTPTAPAYGIKNLLNPSVGLRDVASGTQLTAPNGVASGVSNAGRGFRFSEASNQYLGGIAPVGMSARYSIVAVVRPTGTDSSYSNIFCLANSSGNALLQIRHTASNWDFYHNSTAGWKLAQMPYVNNAVAVIVATWDGATIKLFSGGTLISSTACSGYNAGLPTSGLVGADIDLGNPLAGTYFDGDIALLGFAGGACWSDRQAGETSVTPWQIFEDEEDFIFIPTAGGGGPASITGTLTATLDSINTNFVAAVGHSGTSTTTLQDISATISGTVGHVGNLAITLDNVNATFSGSVSAAGSVSGTIAFTLADIVASASGVVGHSGTISANLADVMVSMAGTVAGTPESITGTLAITLDGIGFTASGNSGTITLTADDIAAIKAAIMSDPKLLTVPKFIALK